MIYSADFETTTDPNDCRVWAWAVCVIEDERNIWFGDDIQCFVEFMMKNQGEYYFHNAGFDSEFIFSYLLKDNGYTWNYQAPYVSGLPAADHYNFVAPCDGYYNTVLVGGLKTSPSTDGIIAIGAA